MAQIDCNLFSFNLYRNRKIKWIGSDTFSKSSRLNKKIIGSIKNCGLSKIKV